MNYFNNLVKSRISRLRNITLIKNCFGSNHNVSGIKVDSLEIYPKPVNKEFVALTVSQNLQSYISIYYKSLNANQLSERSGFLAGDIYQLIRDGLVSNPVNQCTFTKQHLKELGYITESIKTGLKLPSLCITPNLY